VLSPSQCYYCQEFLAADKVEVDPNREEKKQYLVSVSSPLWQNPY
jgi:hypothetical protein